MDGSFWGRVLEGRATRFVHTRRRFAKGVSTLRIGFSPTTPNARCRYRGNREYDGAIGNARLRVATEWGSGVGVDTRDDVDGCSRACVPLGGDHGGGTLPLPWLSVAAKLDTAGRVAGRHFRRNVHEAW